MSYEEEFGPDEIDPNQLSLFEERCWTIYQELNGEWKPLKSSMGNLTFAEAKKITDMKNRQ
jgi:hypothetical protein